MKKLIIIYFLCMGLILTSCSDGSLDETVDFSKYEGSWNLYIEEMDTFTALEPVLGRTAIDIIKIEGNKATGEITCISGGPSLRVANVEFEGEIVDDKLTAKYQDESWEYGGTINLDFKGDHILADISRDETAVVPGWGILEGQFKFIRPVFTEVVELKDEERLAIEEVVDVLEEENLEPDIKILLKDSENENIYYAFVDYKVEKETKEIAYQNIIKLEKNDKYTIKETKEMDYPLEFNMIIDLL